MLCSVQRLGRLAVQRHTVLCRALTRSNTAAVYIAPALSRSFADTVTRERPKMFGFTGKVAEALLDDANDEGDVDNIADELRAFEVVLDDPIMQTELTSPLLQGDDFKPLLEELYTEFEITSETAKNLISGLVTNNSTHQLKRILDDFDRLRDFDSGEVRAVVTSAQPLSPDQLQRLRTALEKQLGEHETLELEEEVDDSLIGGLKVEMDDRSIDLTVSQRLGELDQALRSE